MGARQVTADAEPSAPSSAESLCGTRLRLGGFFLPILRRCICVERVEKTSRDRGDFIDRSQERSFVRLRRFVKAADFPHELERGSSNLLASDGRIEVEEGFDIPAHSVGPPYTVFNNPNSHAARGHEKSSHKERRGGRPLFQGDRSGLVRNPEPLGEYWGTMGEQAPFRAVRRPCFVSSLTPLRAMVSIRTISVASRNEARKVGAVIYLSTNRPLHLPDFLAEFHQCWPHLLPQKTGKEPPEPCSVSASPTSHSNFITRPSRKRFLGPFVHATLRWPEADAALAGHPAHRSVAESAENRLRSHQGDCRARPGH
jgi:hypothetical protein